MRTFGIVTLVLLVLGVLVVGGGYVGTYNSARNASADAKTAWGDIQAQLQRRHDLVPNLVATVKAAAAHEKETFTAVTEARAKVGQLSVQLQGGAIPNAEVMKQFAAAQDGLSAALSKLMVVAEKYPDLKVNENFLTLQAQLEGTENRISVARQHYNEKVGDLEKAKTTLLFGGWAAGNFELPPRFESSAAAQGGPPKVSFD
ncbi:LemA family protein [Candidatus Peregrinibacteria bacterium CG10_big_fil_rev_8_21_14_0_10_49_16]|nr:MAG: LemA family protein [Candidatus Peregrinibacteria bacterium CG22_combo_CG10-13_8_21_14_all_49_11]PIR51805.1 MAG: LemA family protein [Candidatus Peregrinibacteria bacterium CG10_big_fil_rev_8_21_14_0_10_49_16]